ncbi:hypothetical protein BGZ58_009003 [Dissophora ornata]|nr:hypothetical protein BGZ58_009003 [Dissophora ornata]
MAHRDGSVHTSHPEYATYAMRGGSYDDHYGHGTMHEDHMDGNGNVRHGLVNSGSNSGMNSTMRVDKHRNNSISSNASSSSSSSTANKHPCKFPTCNWSFKRFEHLKRHMLVHTKERPFVCEFQGCDKSFSRSDNFSAHLRTHTKRTMHMRKFDRHMMLDSMNFVPLNMSSGHGSPGVGVAGAPIGGMVTGGMVGAAGGHHGGYSDFANPRSSPSSGVGHNGGTPARKNTTSRSVPINKP